MSDEKAAGRALEFKTAGEKTLNKSSIFGFGRSQKFEDAAEHFKKAGNQFKLANMYKSAGDVFIQASDAYTSAGSDFNTEVAQMVVEAANCYKKESPLDAANTFRRAIDIYKENGRFGMAARYAKELAEVFEADNNATDAVAAYEEAAKYFDDDNKKTNSLQCKQKIAQLSIEAGELMKAAEIFEEAGREAMSSRLGQYSAKGHFFSCLVCHLALGDTVQVSQKLDAFKNVDFSFATARECEFVEKILKSLEEFNSDDFAQACADFDRISPLDPTKTSLLLKAKQVISEQTGGDAEVDLT